MGPPGLRRRSLLFVPAILATMVIALGLYGLLGWQAKNREDAREDLVAGAGVAAAQLEAMVLGSLPTLSSSLEGRLDGGPLSAGVIPDIGGVGAWGVDARGRVLAESDEGGPPPPRRELAALATAAPAISNLVRERDVPDAVRIAVPLRASRDLEAVVASYPLALVSSYVEAAIGRVRLPDGGAAAVLDGDGGIVATLGVDGPLLARPGSGLPSRAAAEVEVRGEPWLVAASPVEGTSWRVVTGGSSAAVFADNGGPAGWAGFAALGLLAVAALAVLGLLRRVQRDTAELATLNERLAERTSEAEEAVRAKSSFISSVAHELRTPLAAITMFAELMKRDTEDRLSPAHRRSVDDIAASANHVLALLDDTMDISRAEQGRLDLRPERISLAALAIGVVDGLHPLASQRSVRLSLEADGSIGEVYLDPARLRQVMTNFLSNALKFTPAGGRATMRVARHGPTSVAIMVEDTGLGIPPENLERVFDSMGRVTKPVRDEDETRGLGLSLTRRIVEAMGGYVGVESEPGRGSKFYAVLPRVNAERRGGSDPTGRRRRPSQAEAPSAAEVDQRFSAIGPRARPAPGQT